MITAELDADTLPESMRDARRWLVWRSIPVPDKKPRKVPFYANGKPRHGRLDDAADIAQLASFVDACDALASGQYTGLGFALGPDGTGGHWQGIDLDDLPSRPELALLADDGLPGYTESSPSGNGLHAIGYGRPFPALGSNGSGIEAYSAGRFFTVTGEGAGLGEPIDLHDYVTRTLAPRHAPNAAPTPDNVTEYMDPRTAADLRSALASMRADDRDLWVANGQRLKKLGERGRALWVEWSQQSDKYDPADAARVWDSFTADHTGYQAVFAAASRHGWLNPLSGVVPSSSAPPTQPTAIVASIGSALDEAATPFTDAEFDAAAIPHPHAFMAPDGKRGLFPAGEVTVLAAPGREGKTTVITAIAKHFALGWALGGMAPVEVGSVMIYSAEDDRAQYARKVQAQRSRLPADDAARLQSNIIVPDLHGELLAGWREIVRLEGRQPVRGPILAALIDTIRRLMARECPLGLAIFETASTLSDAEEDNVGLRVLVSALKHVAKVTGVAVVLTHHTSQEAAKALPTLDLSESAFRGGTALVNNARQTLLAVNLGSAFDPFPEADSREVLRSLVAPGEKDRVTLLACLSSSKSAEPVPLFFRWDDVDPYGPRAVEINTPADLSGKSWRSVHKSLQGAKADAAAERKLEKEQANVRLVIRAVVELCEAKEYATVRKVSNRCGFGADWAKSRLAAAVESGDLVRSTEQIPRVNGLTDVFRPAGATRPWDDSSAPWRNRPVGSYSEKPTGDYK
ncbi:hypothetical protein CSC70_03900 [Pseudoxanthomonas kalamensis DSM 18571]|uniref:AAA family ATPase n=1 Tax=Pseudoxanthomonas kalamensis TaxID=289483 RepID=UPI001391AE2E|nr:AAA family ATPase [Pseudoxanthomonas kalamensis]KAF1711079.1 hypothetical protein CSC70_03900 [Pseudoxanthomonas kalamensis DSM 18571]